MKIRTNFVSNSSSTSFVLFGTLISKEEAMNTSEPILCIGKDLYEGEDVFELTEEMRVFLPKSRWLYFYKNYTLLCTEDEEIYKKDELKLPECFVVSSVEKDYNSTNDLDAFYERYVNEN